MTTQPKRFVHTAVDVATTTTPVVATSTTRTWLLLVNDSDTDIYVKFGDPAVANEGIRLNAEGGSLEISHETGFIDRRAINAIHAGTGTKRLLATEG